MSEGATAPQQMILVVDDDSSQAALLRAFLHRCGFTTVQASSAEQAFEVLRERPISMIVSDVRMQPGMSGLEMLREVRKTHPTLPVLLVTAYPGIRDAVEAMRDGAVNYLEKPIDLDELLTSVSRGLGITQAVEWREDNVEVPDDVIAESPAMRELIRETLMVAPTDSRVLITGESGSGKEVIADLIHRYSNRSKAMFTKVNCAAIPEPLLESELFGHEKGAFTGAGARHIGYFEQAAGGTILLDEIAEMAQAMQAKLLRVIQDGSFRRVGGTQNLHADVRIIASTNRDLEADIKSGRFREDLFYRLNVFELHAAPLRERPEDVLPLARFFATRFGGSAPRLSPAAVAALEAYNWPGNIRELRNVMERSSLMARGSAILPQHLPTRLQPAVSRTIPDPESSAPGMKHIERSIILETLKNNNFNRSETARSLGISRRALIYKLNRFRDEGFTTDAPE